MDYYSAFPFYMGYQGYGQWAQPGMVPEDRILEDLEYLRQMYPTYARKYQNTIGSVVDKMDYDGSFIYDQYPDKLTMQRMVESVMAVIRTNEENSAREPQDAQPDAGRMMSEGAEMQQNLQEFSGQGMSVSELSGRVTDKTLTERAPWREKEPWIRELVTVLMYYEILVRRRKRNRNNMYYQF